MDGAKSHEQIHWNMAIEMKWTLDIRDNNSWFSNILPAYRWVEKKIYCSTFELIQISLSNLYSEYSIDSTAR